MSWSCRVIRHSNGEHAIHEVYYDDETGRPHSCTEEPANVCEDDLETLRHSIARALEEPVLEMSMFEPKTPAPGQSSKGT